MGQSKAKKMRKKNLREGKRNVEKQRSIYSATKEGQHFMRERKMPTKYELLTKNKHKHKHKRIDIENDSDSLVFFS